MRIKLIAFDCFGTVFDMCGVPKEEIVDYVKHVKRKDFSPYVFPKSWYDLKAYPDSAIGIRRLRQAGFACAAFSNGSPELIAAISKANRIEWDEIADLAGCGVYKPHVDAYRTIESQWGYDPDECLMVTANPTFGDIEGADAIGMMSQVIRNGWPNDINELADIWAVAKEASNGVTLGE